MTYRGSREQPPNRFIGWCADTLPVILENVLCVAAGLAGIAMLVAAALGKMP